MYGEALREKQNWRSLKTALKEGARFGLGMKDSSLLLIICLQGSSAKRHPSIDLRLSAPSLRFHMLTKWPVATSVFSAQF